MHRLLAAYWEGRRAYPAGEPNPYPDDYPAARMWRLGWQYARDQDHGTPNPPSTELDELREDEL